MNENLLKFQPFSTVQSISFWQKLSDLKLNLYQLNDSTRLIYGHYSTSAKPKIPARLFFDEESFETNKPPKFEHVRIKVPATLKLFNTASGFKNCKSNELLRKSAEQIFSGIFDGSVLLDPSVLNSVLFLAFADLKLNRFSYLVGIPAIISPRPFERRFLLKSALAATEGKFLDNFFRTMLCLHFSPLFVQKPNLKLKI